MTNIIDNLRELEKCGPAFQEGTIADLSSAPLVALSSIFYSPFSSFLSTFSFISFLSREDPQSLSHLSSEDL